MTITITKPPINIREKLAELERPIGLNGAALMATSTPQEAFSLIGAGRKNLIINGDFSVSQRGTYTSSTAVSHATYYLDRWFADISSGITATFRHITTDLPKQYRNISNRGLRFEATSSNSNAYIGFRQKYEFMSGLDGKYITVSAWVKSNTRAVIINYDGSGSNFKYAQHSGSGNWEYLSYTTFVSSVASNHFDIFLINPITYAFTSINSGDYVEVTNYQVEVGKVATPFEHRSYGEELALCQRYCYNAIVPGSQGNVCAGLLQAGYGVGPNNVGILYFQLPVPMRTIPTLDWSNLEYNNSGGAITISPGNITLGTSSSTTNAVSLTINGNVNTMPRGSELNIRTTNSTGYLRFTSEL